MLRPRVPCCQAMKDEPACFEPTALYSFVPGLLRGSFENTSKLQKRLVFFFKKVQFNWRDLKAATVRVCRCVRGLVGAKCCKGYWFLRSLPAWAAECGTACEEHERDRVHFHRGPARKDGWQKFNSILILGFPFLETDRTAVTVTNDGNYFFQPANESMPGLSVGVRLTWKAAIIISYACVKQIKIYSVHNASVNTSLHQQFYSFAQIRFKILGFVQVRLSLQQLFM